MSRRLRTIVKHDQREDDDCLRACVATILAIPDDDTVPHFREAGLDFMDEIRAWTLDHTDHQWGFDFDDRVQFPLLDDNDGWAVIAVGPSPRTQLMPHAVVVHPVTGKVLHDPHPSRAGLAGPIRYLLRMRPGGRMIDR